MPKHCACHLSARAVTNTLYRSTLQRACAAHKARACSSEPPCGVGLRELSASEAHSPHVAARLVGSYPTFSPLPALRAKRHRRLFSSALLSSRELLPIKKRNALCCPDFPPASYRMHATGRPAGSILTAKVQKTNLLRCAFREKGYLCFA